MLGYFAPKFWQCEGLGYAFDLKTERETGTTFILLGVGQNSAFPWKQTMIFTKSEPPQHAHTGPGGKELRGSQRLRFLREPIPAPAQGSLPTRAAQVGDGRVNVRKLNVKMKAQTITSP